MIIRYNVYYFSIKTYVVTPHLTCLNEIVQMRVHNIWFHGETRKIIPQLSSNTPSYLEINLTFKSRNNMQNEKDGPYFEVPAIQASSVTLT